jgi:hypothetical protein
MIFGNGIAKTKLVEQLTLVTLQTAHHGSTSPRIPSTQRNHASTPVSTDFCNKIEGKADLASPLYRYSAGSATRSEGRASAGGGSRIATRSPWSRHEVVTYVLGTTCYRCLRAGQ